MLRIDRPAALERDYVECLSAADITTPLGIMRFRLTYDGVLPSKNARNSWAPIKWQIRQQISEQLAELYEVHPVLSTPPRIMMISHDSDSRHSSVIDAAREPIMVGGHPCIPLVRKSLALSCALDVLFLRCQKAGHLISGGDIDNRIQLLFDALQMPSMSDMNSAVPATIPAHYLLEDDKLITGISVQTDRLLTRPADRNHAVLLIDVTVRVMQLTASNIGFIGD